jgi:hypothetical protein
LEGISLPGCAPAIVPVEVHHARWSRMEFALHQPYSGDAQGIDSVIQRGQRIVSYGMNFDLKHTFVGHG